jgi:predicted nucleic acid-binding protein
VVSSVITEVEVIRAVRRLSGPASNTAAQVLASIDTIELTASVRQIASAMEPAVLRLLDAVHLATALAIGVDLSTLVAYDRRLLSSADAAGLPTKIVV